MVTVTDISMQAKVKKKDYVLWLRYVPQSRLSDAMLADGPLRRGGGGRIQKGAGGAGDKRRSRIPVYLL